MSLLHTMRTNYGTCSDIVEDYCSDTPTRKEISDTYGFDACCGWNGGENCSNNLMDYSGNEVITPEQLGRIHWTIVNEIEEYKSCFFTNSVVSITGFVNNSSFIGESVSIPSSSSISVGQGKTLYVSAEEFTVDGELEVASGGSIVVNTSPDCN